MDRRSTIVVGAPGGEPFAARGALPPADVLAVLVDSSVDTHGAFRRRQHDVREALERDGTVVLLVGPRIAEGLGTQFGCWVRAKIGLDIMPWFDGRPMVDGRVGYAALRFFGDPPRGATELARSRECLLAGVRFPGDCSDIIVYPAPRDLDATVTRELVEHLARVGSGAPA